jgi:hypothetical protein
MPELDISDVPLPPALSRLLVFAFLQGTHVDAHP